MTGLARTMFPALLRRSALTAGALISISTAACAEGPAPDERARPSSAVGTADIQYFYPERAMRLGVSGEASVRCRVQNDGSLIDCAVVSETPPGFGFGVASTRAAQRFFQAEPPHGD